MRRIDWLRDLRRRAGHASTVMVGGLGLAVVAGALWIARPHGTPVAPAPSVPTVAVESPRQAPVVVATAPEVAVAPAVVATPHPQLTLAERVRGHLAAGEFGVAFDLALSATTPAEQAELLHSVASAQVSSGDFATAKRTLAKLPLGFGDANVLADADHSASLAGGNAADFTQLIALIEQETGNEDYGPWLNVHGSGGTMSQFNSGVRVDPNGVLALAAKVDRSGDLESLGQRAREAALNADMSQPSALRMVSLTRLEQAVSDRLAAGKPVVESMRQLAGLAEIKYVFVYADDHEIVVAGPAEGWRYDEQGRAVGATQGRPTLQLDDLVTVLRTFSRDGMNVFGCSIDPKPENLQALQEFVAASQARGPLSNGQAGRWTKQLQDKLGMQEVTVFGVPADSRVARVIVEADYRMKLIGVGKLDAGSQIPDYFSLLAEHPEQAGGRIDGLRWWLTLQCQHVFQSADRAAFEINGSTVKCLSENEFLDNQGQRVHTGEAEPTNRLFAANFTANYGDLARREPIFADMEGVFNLALVAALIQHDGLDRQAGWDRGAFGNGGEFITARYPTPKEVETIANHRVFGGKDVVAQVAGGVKGDLFSLLNDSEARGVNPKLDGVAHQSRASELPAGRWWWDAK